MSCETSAGVVRRATVLLRSVLVPSGDALHFDGGDGGLPVVEDVPVMVDSKRLMFYLLSVEARDARRAQSAQLMREHVHKTLVRAVRLHVAEAEAAQVAGAG